MQVMLGSSTLHVPFAFPSGEVARLMTAMGLSTSSNRAKQLVVLYWDGVDEKKIPVLSQISLASRRTVKDFLVGKGVGDSEALYFTSAMISLEDRQWLEPSWSITKTVIQDTTGTGRAGEGGSKAFDFSKLLWPALGAVAVYAAVTGVTRGIFSR